MAWITKRQGRDGVTRFRVGWRIGKVRDSESCADHAEALRKCALYARTKEGKAPPSERTDASDALLRFLREQRNEETRDFYREKVGGFIDATKRPMPSWDRHDLAAYVASRKEWGPNTTRKLLGALRTFVRWCRSQRVPIDVGDPVDGAKRPKSERFVGFAWTPTERDAILAAARARQDVGGMRLEVPCALSLYAALDLPDLRTVRWDDLDTSGSTWYVTGRRHKTGVPGRIPVCDELRVILERRRATHGLMCRDIPSSDASLYQGFKRIQAKAGIPALRRGGWKTARRTCLTLLGMSGADTATIREIARHAPGSRETEKYLFTTEARKIAAVNAASKAATA